MEEFLAFFGASLSDFKTTASLFPSSEGVVDAMTAPLPLASARCVVELGAGTGVITGALLEGLGPEGRLVAFEINPKLADYVRVRFNDTRLTVVTRSAEFLGEELAALGLGPADAIVSSLGLTFLPDDVRHRIFDAAAAALRPGGLLTQYVYMHGRLVPFRKFDDEFQAFPAEDFIRERFASFRRRQVWRNFPPAFVYVCRR